ncbi:hypothetical protein LEMLEM_LOCUS19067, partial [Lemmus lemmus]
AVVWQCSALEAPLQTPPSCVLVCPAGSDSEGALAGRGPAWESVAVVFPLMAGPWAAAPAATLLLLGGSALGRQGILRISLRSSAVCQGHRDSPRDTGLFHIHKACTVGKQPAISGRGPDPSYLRTWPRPQLSQDPKILMPTNQQETVSRT